MSCAYCAKTKAYAPIRGMCNNRTRGPLIIILYTNAMNIVNMESIAYNNS